MNLLARIEWRVNITWLFASAFLIHFSSVAEQLTVAAAFKRPQCEPYASSIVAAFSEVWSLSISFYHLKSWCIFIICSRFVRILARASILTFLFLCLFLPLDYFHQQPDVESYPTTHRRPHSGDLGPDARAFPRVRAWFLLRRDREVL